MIFCCVYFGVCFCQICDIIDTYQNNRHADLGLKADPNQSAFQNVYKSFHCKKGEVISLTAIIKKQISTSIYVFRRKNIAGAFQHFALNLVFAKIFGVVSCIPYLPRFCSLKKC